MKVTVSVEVDNMPANIRTGWMVIRRDEHDAQLWYYGIYPEKEKADIAALEIGNGIVTYITESEEV